MLTRKQFELLRFIHERVKEAGPGAPVEILYTDREWSEPATSIRR